MNTDFYQTVLALKNAGSSFVTATVVSRRAPVSSHLGDRAIVFENGKMQGFVGGSCSREIVRKQALEALRLGKPRLVLIRPDATLEAMAHAEGAESIVVPMTCASEGAVDVYLEPHAPARLLLVAGYTPVAEAVCKMATLLEYDVLRVVSHQEHQDLETRAIALTDLPKFLEPLSEHTKANLAAVVATQGHYDEPVLEALLNADVGFISLLASRKRAVTVRELLELQGISLEKIARIRNPAGIDINAKTPPEVAVSILAEIIQQTPNTRPMFTNSSHYTAPEPRGGKLDVRPSLDNGKPLTGQVQARVAREVLSYEQEDPLLHDLNNDSEINNGFRRGDPRGRPATHAEYNPPPNDGFAISPVDGERIEIATAVHFADHNGTTYYFTCANCKRRFLKDPEKYLSVTQ